MAKLIRSIIIVFSIFCFNISSYSQSLDSIKIERFKKHVSQWLVPEVVAKKHTSVLNRTDRFKRGPGPEPVWKASLPKRFKKSCFGLVGPRTGRKRTHIGFEQNRSVQKGLRPGTLLESIVAEAIPKRAVSD